MNTIQPEGRASGRKRLGVTSLVLTALLLAGCASVPASGAPKDDKGDGADGRPGGPPAHFVLSITPQLEIDPPPTISVPSTITVPPTRPTVPPTRPTISVPPTVTIPPTFTVPPVEPTIWPGPPVDDLPADAADDSDLVDLELPPRPGPDWMSPRRVVLACSPDAGTHPDPRAACDALRAVRGQFEKLGPDEPYPCTMEYAPVKVEAIGYWGDTRVSYTETFPNPCIAAVETGFVFQF